MTRRILDVKTADDLGALDPDAVARVKDEAWPRPADAEEVHEALLWMGYVTAGEAAPWQEWLDTLAAAGRVVREAIASSPWRPRAIPRRSCAAGWRRWGPCS